MKSSRGKWLKSARITPAEETTNISKREKIPGPGAYKPDRKQRVKGAFNQTTEQMQMFNNQKYYSMQTPSCGKYDPECWVSQNLNCNVLQEIHENQVAEQTDPPP